MLKNIFKLYSESQNDDIIVCYYGPLAQTNIEGFSVPIRERLALDTVPPNTSMAIFSIFVEQVQNMLFYSHEHPPKSPTDSTNPTNAKAYPSGVFILSRKGDTYFTQSGNAVRNADITHLEKNINYLNSLSQDELKEYYRARRKADNDNPLSQGAGLGFIEMARRSTSALEYTITKIDEHRSFFALSAAITIS